MNGLSRLKGRRAIFRAGIIAAILNFSVAWLSASENGQILQGPHFALVLTLNEFSILNVSEKDGLLKYGGSGDFQLKMLKVESNVVWDVTINDPRLMELLGIFVGEKTIDLVQGLDPNNLDPNQKIALDAIKSLTQKLEYARKHPAWESVRLSGAIAHQGTNWLLETKDDSFRITGDKLPDIAAQVGKSIVANGIVKIPGVFEISSFAEKQENTLNLFVMSFCPFGQKAEAQLLAFLDSTNNIAKPSLDIHYIFYKMQQDGKEGFLSLHGDAEVTENLVQIIIRDHFPFAIFRDYLRLRSKSADADWRTLAEQIGMSKENIAFIESSVQSDRDAAIRTEYEFVANRYGVTDGSPSYVWESERVTDLKNIPAFKGLDEIKVETCTH